MDDFGINSGYVAELLDRYLQNPDSVDAGWRTYFASRLPGGQIAHTNGNGAGATTNGNGTGTNGHGAQAIPTVPVNRPSMIAMSTLQGRVSQLINAYRVRGHLFARVDPLRLEPAAPPQLGLSNFDLTENDLDRTFSTIDMPGPKTATLRDIIQQLETTYCRSIGAEFSHLEDPEERAWLQDRMESTQNRLRLGREEQIRILTKLIDAEILEQFIHKNYVGAKRFSLEGAESLIPLLDLLVETAGAQDVGEIVLAMAHRGRLNVLANIMNKNIREIFSAFEAGAPEKYLGSGDVKYHLGYSTDHKTASGHNVHLTLAFNPSHLEWVNPVVEGRVRAKQDRRGDRDRRRVMPLLIHGDASFMGQGVVGETLNLAGLTGYRTGGTIHVVVNNQIGFTTLPEDSRSSMYATDIAKMIEVPIFHVNGDDPLACMQVSQLALDFRQEFGRDIVIDMYCYRRFGHNEGDEPAFTQPDLYAKIDKHPSVAQLYKRELLESGAMTDDDAASLETEFGLRLEMTLDDVKAIEKQKANDQAKFKESSAVFQPEYTSSPVSTAINQKELKTIVDALTRVPDDFNVQPKIKRIILEHRRKVFENGGPYEWHYAELLAFGSLLLEGTPVRLSGQDSARGTFSTRHAILYDAKTGAPYVPLMHLGEKQARICIYNSLLSEAAVLGFDYGYSLDYPSMLCLWEAQFGDFSNGAQTIVDQFIVSAESKWQRPSGIVLLLPHGYEGQGPEHSSGRLERFLQLCAEDNIQVCNLTTAAQYFHLLRRQMKRDFVKPLIIMTPKSLLCSEPASSRAEDFTSGGFSEILGSPEVGPPEKMKRVILCSGKVYYDLLNYRTAEDIANASIIRIEQLYPLAETKLHEALKPFPKTAKLIWCQEESQNMGAWSYMEPRLWALFGRKIIYAGRNASASPAVGSLVVHKREQAQLIADAFSL